MKQTLASDNRLWYVAQVKATQEKNVRAQLIKLGYDAYVPVHKELHTYTNRTCRTVEKVLMPGIVFVCLNDEERSLMLHFPFINKFLVNNSLPVSKVGRAVHPFATFTDAQMEKMQSRMETAEIALQILGQYPLKVIQSVTI